jgi:hypothetical protein
MAIKINVKKSYNVKLTRIVKWAPFTYYPLNEINMRGSLVAAIVEREGEEVLEYAREV